MVATFLAELKRYDEAFAAYDKGLSFESDLAEALAGRGNVSTDLKRFDEALAAYDKTLAIKPDLPGGWLGRGNVFFANLSAMTRPLQLMTRR